MKNIAIGIILGALLVIVVTWLFVLPMTRESYLAVGHNNGLTSARDELANQVASKLGTDLQRSEAQTVIFSVKHRSVVVVDRNGVKTLRVVE
jgi:hypothetical protein